MRLSCQTKPPRLQSAICRRSRGWNRMRSANLVWRTSYLSGRISHRARLVIRDRVQFNELWNEIMRHVSDKPPLPEVDFSREMLIVAAMGQQPSPYEIIVDGACEVDNQLEVLVRSTKSDWCGAIVGLLPETVDIVRLPKTDLPVVFRETEVTSDCNGVLRPAG